MKNEDIEKSEKDEVVLSLQDTRDLLDIVYILNAIIKTGGNITHSADELQIGRRTIYELMDKYGISFADEKLSIKIRPLIQYIEVCSPYIEKYLK
jgi:DNA-binding NtrC family response regulator